MTIELFLVYCFDALLFWVGVQIVYKAFRDERKRRRTK